MPTHTLHQLTPRAWWLDPYAATDRPALGVIVGDRGSLVVDAGASPDHVAALRGEMARHGLPAPHFVALTHWHWDHVFGAASLGVPAVAGRETRRILLRLAALDWGDAALDERVAAGAEIAFCRDMLKLEWPDRAGLTIEPPAIAFDGELTLDLGGIECRLIHVGGNHSPDGIVAYVPAERVAFIGDAIYEDMYHGPNRLTVGQLFPLLDRLTALDVDTYITGHDLAPLSRSRFLADADAMRAIGAAVVRTGDSREAALAAAASDLGAPLDDDQVATLDAFLAGLRKPYVEPMI